MNASGRTGYAGRLALSTFLLTAVAILAAATQPDINSAPVWPATALGLALMWRHGVAYWPAVLVSNFFLAQYAGVASPWLALGNASLELLVALLALSLLWRFRVDISLAGLKPLGAFLLIAAVACVPVTIVFPAVVVFLFGDPIGVSLQQGFHYWASSFFSLMIFTPLLVSAPQLPSMGLRRLGRLALLLVAAVLVGAGVVVFERATGEQMLFLLLPLVTACSIVAGVTGASAAAFVVTMCVILTEASADPSPLATQTRVLFAATVIVTGYLLGAIWSDRRRASEELEHRARHDALTGLMNRFEFERMLHAALRGEPGQNALLYLDLDQFKLLNDTCGHMAGDEVLRELGASLSCALPPSAELARLGGDEFGCLIRRCSEETARDIAEILLNTIRDFRYASGDLQFSLGVSIGVTWFSANTGDTADSVLGRADVACYAAKEEGRNRVHVYRPGDAAMLRRHWEIREASQLQAALEAGRFELHAQRICNIGVPDSQERFYEVLLRLRDDSGKTVSAAEFLPVAQRYGMISLIDRWVLEQAASFLGGQADSQLRLSVNLSGATLDMPGFAEMIAALPVRYGFSPRQFCLEVTESVAINRLTRAVEGMQQLRRQGFEIALDDFGSGVASFGYLSELPVSLVKLDGRFVRDIGSDPAAELVIETLVQVAALRNIRCVAEWVEKEDALERLRALGVHYAQGFLLHRPAPLRRLENSNRQVTHVSGE
ncbi:MAG TPA: EAL domain-containing protein [Gammaproteobacteria bacterium]